MTKAKTLLLRVEQLLSPLGGKLKGIQRILLVNETELWITDHILAAATAHTITLTPATADRPAVVVLVPDGWRQVTRGNTREGDLKWSDGMWGSGIVAGFAIGHRIIIRRIEGKVPPIPRGFKRLK